MQTQLISIHAPREGGDAEAGHPAADLTDFNPRPPRGGRPHAVGGRKSVLRHFNPRPPRGGRPIRFRRMWFPPLFQSTPPARGATHCTTFPIIGGGVFQSTPPARGATPFWVYAYFFAPFQSTPPARGATPCTDPSKALVCNFNPRPPRGGRRAPGGRHDLQRTDFNPRPPRGGRRPQGWYQ